MSAREQRAAIVARAAGIVREIDQIVADTEHWNRTHPLELPIDPDPDGMLVRARAAMTRVVRD
jgi:hypothetical protein